MKIRCKNCGHNRELTCKEMEKLRKQKIFGCSKCNSTYDLLEIELDCQMQELWFSNEEEVRCILINASLKQYMQIWDCRGEAGKCPDPLRVLRIPLVLKSGDFLLFWNGRYYAIEVKFPKNSCGKGGRLNLYYGKRSPIEMRKLQMDLLLNGGGVLVIVAEPTLKQLGIELGGHKEQADCERPLKRDLKSKLATGEIPYEVWILDQTRFKRVWDAGFKAKPFFDEPHLPLNMRRKKLGFDELEKSVPESRVMLPIANFHSGRIMELVLQVLSGSG